MNAADFNDIYLVDSLRTPLGRTNKSLKNFTAIDLGAHVIRELVQKNKIDNRQIDRVILGNTVAAGLGQNPARQAAVAAGLSVSVSALTINSVCGSGLQSVICAVKDIMLGEAQAVIAGGAESSTHCPLLLEKKERDQKEKNFKDSLIHDGLWCHMSGKHMGELTEDIADAYGITREMQDQYALVSHQKAVAAKTKGNFQKEIVPVKLPDGKYFSEDERPRTNINLKKMTDLPPSFRDGGTLTAGNSSAPADGAAACLLASKQFVQKHHLKPKARILGYATLFIDPKEAFTSTIAGTKNCLEKCGLKVEDIDLYEIIEAFAVQAILTMRELRLPKEKVNIYGGDIAFGHPLGAADSRILVTLLHALENEKKSKGLVSICFGGGGAVAMVVEIVK